MNTLLTENLKSQIAYRISHIREICDSRLTIADLRLIEQKTDHK